MKPSNIISEIDELVKSQTEGVYSKWRIGRANDVEESKTQHGNPDSWRDWDVDTVEGAIKVESYFIEKGMRQEGEGYGDADFIYVFFAGSPQENL
jgi:hypothetical protein